MASSSKVPRISWLFQAIVAVLLLPPMFLKLSGAEEPRTLFEQLGAEPLGRLATGVFELGAIVMILVPATVVFGALLACGLMMGALASHILFLGVSGDQLQLVIMALIILFSSLGVLWLRRQEIPLLT